MIHNVWHSTSAQPLYFRRDSSRIDVSNCGWNRELPGADHEPIPCALAAGMDNLMGNNVAGRAVSCPVYTSGISGANARRARKLGH
jgi:hypothetical protein